MGRAEQPDIRLLALGLTAGVLGVHLLPAPPPLTWLLAAVIPVLVPWRGRKLWSTILLGVLAAVWHGQTYLDERWPTERHGEELWVRGQVVSLPELAVAHDRPDRRERGEDKIWRFSFEPEDANLPKTMRVSWYRTEEVVRGGDCWNLRLRVRTPRGSFNPSGFDYEGWLYQRGIAATATVKDGETCVAGNASRILRWRQTLREHLAAWLPAHPALPMVAALTLGDDSAFTDADWDAFRLTGTSHLVAISGFNVAIVATLAFFLFRWLWVLIPRAALWLPAQKIALVASAFSGLAYSLLAGWDSPVQRAALMLMALLLAAAFDRLGAPSRVLALVWFLMLLVDPPASLSPGLWLSFGAVAAIFFVSSGRLRRGVGWREAVWLQLMLSVVLAPLTVLFFHGAALLGPPVNLVAVPIMVVLTPLVLFAVLLALFVPAAGVPALAAIADLLMHLQQGLAWIAQQWAQSWLPAAPPAAAIAMALFGALLLFAPRGWPGRWLGLLCIAPMFLQAPRPPSGGLEIAAIDVGQGLAVVVRTAHHALLYDAGPAFEDGFDAGESAVAPYLLGLGIRRLDLLLLSHGDNDHAGGVPAVRRLLRVDRELGTDGSEPCRDGQRWEWDGVRFSLLHPDDATWSDNNGSCVLKIDGSFSALLAGDIEKGAEQRLLAAHAQALKADLLIAPHHGSKTSSTEEFVRAVAPARVIFGAAWRSHYRHPRPEVVQRYVDVGALPSVTGVSGTVRIWRDGEGRLAIEEWRPKAARFWNAAAQP